MLGQTGPYTNENAARSAADSLKASGYKKVKIGYDETNVNAMGFYIFYEIPGTARRPEDVLKDLMIPTT